MDVNDFYKLWDREPNEKELDDLKDYWNLRADEFNNRGRDNCVELKTVLDLKNFDGRGKSVLDIGCGPGKCVNDLSKEFEKAVGIDISENMITHARENAAKLGIENVEFINAPWEKINLKEIGWENNFDVVVASMTPGISSGEQLVKMNEASREVCMLSSFVYRRDLKSDICDHLKISKPEDPARNKIYIAFNILWHMGIYPEIFYFDPTIIRNYTLEEAVELYGKELSLDAKEWDRLSSYLENKIDPDGMIRQNYTAKVAWLYWESKKSGAR
ncbi:class I SAM-dependent methyltransferase [Alkalibacter mobilis]|uniref:class I SAM-dependent methyltransferase n=1 Tax=Alkalibacter mobilis TaxID=2787712 RepID=UPI0018A121AA|nr:class I SAM-dependent methyltransferase [Alkalibacter mobilis]MBF7096401.1 class I SAM-dependent methyltransferase [Alkalibacter mobilis]